jgi:hypothetical protein
MLKSIYSTTEDSSDLTNLKKKLGKKIVDQETNLEVEKEKEEKKPIPKAEALTPIAPKGIMEAKYEMPKAPMPKIKTKSEDTETDTEAKEGGGSAVDGILAGAGGIMDMAGSVLSNTEPMDKKQRTANTIGMATKGMSTGASIGAAVGGPYGMAIGAGAGLLTGVATGLLQGKGDQRKLDAKKRAEEHAKNEKIKLDRETAHKAKDGKISAQKKAAITQGQLSLLGNQ